MALVLKEHVFHGHPVGAHPGHDLIRFHLQHPGVLGALQHDEGFGDLPAVEQGRYGIEAHRVGRVRVAHLGVEGLLERFPPGRDGAQGADPVGHPEEVHPHVECVRGVGEGRHGHVAPVGAPKDADLFPVDVGLGGQPVLPGYAVFEVLVAVVLVVHLVKGLPVARAAPVIHGQHGIAVIDQVLQKGAEVLARLPAGPAVYPDQGRGGVFCAGLVGPVINGRDLQPVEGGETNHLGRYQVGRVDLRVEHVRELLHLTRLQVVYVEVARGVGATGKEAHHLLVG